MRGRTLIFHPFLLAIYPVLFIYAANIDRMRPLYVMRPLLLSLCLSLILLGLFRLVTRDWRRSGLITSLFLILFFSYGHVYALTEGKTLAGITIGRHRILLILWVTAFVLGSWLIWKRLKNTSSVTSFLNIVAIFVLAFPLYGVLIFNMRQLNASSAGAQESLTQSEISQIESAHENLPDIYYIILDAYARQDVLQQLYGYDNAPFITQLESLGFTIAGESRANYGQTGLSIASSLNMDYVQNILDELDSERSDYQQLLDPVKQSRVRSVVESYGYKTVAFSTGYWLTEINDADLYLEYGVSQAKGDVLGSMSKIGQVNPFEVMLAQSTAAILITDYVSHCVTELDVYQASTPQEREQHGLYQSGWISKGCVLFEGLHETLNYPFREHRERIQFVFDKIPELVEVSEPHFVFVHVIVPHFPFVFGSNGEVGAYLEETGKPFWESSYTYGEYLNGYLGQITYVEKRIQEILQDILENSEREPIIIIQADHGPDLTARIYEPTSQEYLSERFPILNAYYLPSSCEPDALYPSITPVNSFRVVLNACFGTDYELLDDRSYWSYYNLPYDFEDVTEKVNP